MWGLVNALCCLVRAFGGSAASTEVRYAMAARFQLWPNSGTRMAYTTFGTHSSIVVSQIFTQRLNKLHKFEVPAPDSCASISDSTSPAHRN